MPFINVADLKDPDDPQGRTYRQVNAARQHAVPLGSLVELPSGVRMFVAAHHRDCDGTPLYALAWDMDVPVYSPDPRLFSGKVYHGISEGSLRVIALTTENTRGNEIAAAPGLLAAAKSLVTYWSNAGTGDDPDGSVAKALMTRLGEAVIEAEGRE